MLHSRRNRRVCVSCSHVEEHVFARIVLLVLGIKACGLWQRFCRLFTLSFSYSVFFILLWPTTLPPFHPILGDRIRPNRDVRGL